MLEDKIARYNELVDRCNNEEIRRLFINSKSTRLNSYLKNVLDELLELQKELYPTIKPIIFLDSFRKD